MLKDLITWYVGSLESGGYPLIALLMAIESSIVPLPSEFVIPPAAVLAHQKGTFSMVGIVIAGALGSWLGATVMYWAARLAGRPLVLKYGRYVLIPPEKVEAAEVWAKRFGPVGVFFSRLLPVVRHLIGIPAGIVRMNYGKYSLYTLVGSALWCAVLCWVGVMAGKDEQLMQGQLHRITLWVVGATVVLGLMYYFLVHRYMKAGPAAPPAAAGQPTPET
ncbi:MAG TPA: DedA family protein [Verrucomicrobiota bacterium]|nr:DedA family protein [Verrucomicrobiota bacterium]HNU52277.1 DedA family protein [Verrucomicrobiota bacterium]